MKKFLIAAAIFLTVVSGAHAEEKRGNITVAGDSIASGYGLSEYVSGNNYSALDSFGNLLANSGHYENYAVDGRRSKELLDAFSDEDDPLVKSVSNAGSVIISIGGNDFLKPMLDAVKTAALTDADFFLSILQGDISAGKISDYSNNILQSAIAAARDVDVGKSVSNIEKIIEKIGEMNPRAKIIILTVYNPFAGNVLFAAASEAAEEKLAELNGGIKALADKNENVLAADVYEAFKGHESEFTNIGKLDIHPNSDGHFRIYELLSELMAEVN